MLINENNPQTGKKLFKSVAVIGFTFLIIALAWLSIQLVNVMPKAFSSLASLTEVVRQKSLVGSHPAEPVFLLVTSNTNLINSGEVVNLSWNTVKSEGSYVFNYRCAEGVSIDIKEPEGGLRNINCDTNYNLGNTDTLSLSVTSSHNRYKDVNFSISFLKTAEETPVASGTDSFTVINNQISDITTEDQPDNNTEGEVGTSTNPVVESETGTNNPTVPVQQVEYIYTIPVSDPKGTVDLATKFVNSGNIIGKTFIPGPIYRDLGGAIQFEVKNYGTKTSGEWTYTMTLPDGDDYTSVKQSPLKPNERAVITLGFPATTKSQYTFSLKVTVTNDRVSSNNQFLKAVDFTR